MVASGQPPPRRANEGPVDRSRVGRAVMRAYLNLRNVLPSPATVLFDATRRAGAAMELAMRVRRHGRLTYEEIRSFAALGGIAESDLTMWLLPTLERARLFTLLRSTTGQLTAVEEQVGVAEPVLDSVGRVWDGLNPADAERCAIAASDHLAYAPYTLSVLRSILEADGFRADMHPEMLKSLAAVGMLRRQRSQALREDVLYSPYVWGTEAVAIGEFLHRLPPNERDVLAGLSRSAAERPGTSVEDLAVASPVVEAARKVGLIEATRVLSSAGSEKAFAFSPSLERQLSLGTTDVTHERKLFVAHILYGHRYGFPGTGRILSPTVLVGALISRGSVGPATAIRTDYPLLEAQGIVKVVVEEGSKRAYLELVKRDVAEDALDLLRVALGEEEPRVARLGGVQSLWVPGTFSSPERDRHLLGDLQPGAEAEVIGSVVDRLRQETARRMRQEEI